MSFKVGFTILNRQSEWTVALFMIGAGITLIFSPQSIELGGFAYVARVGLTAEILRVFFIVGGCMRAASLYANGHWPVFGPIIRAGCAALCGVLWLQMGYVLYLWSHPQGYTSLGVSFYCVLGLSEAVSVYRAVCDGRSN